jgi:Dyp-type peroxidase family
MTSSGANMDLADIQGDILRAYGNDYDCTSYAFVNIGCPPEQGRAWFSGLLDHVTTAEPWPEGTKPLTTLNVAVTAAGLRALGVSDAVVETFSGAFREGMAARSTLLGDVGSSDPKQWEKGLGSGEAHVLLTINAQEPKDHKRALGKMREAMDAAGGITIVYQEDTELLKESREHFGYADGFAQPAVEGSSDNRARGGGVPLKDGGWRALSAGEFILGYPDEDTRVDPKQRLPYAPAAPLGRSGTYMVWRKLYQDVALWRRVIKRAATLYEAGDEDKLSAKVVGRWANGAPLVQYPDAPPEDYDPKTAAANDFRYGEDLDGMRCPVGAHVRRSNPRDGLGAVKGPDGKVLGFEGHLSFRHRMIRRGMPYGTPLPPGVDTDDGADRGLVFVSFQGSIARQFEGVQVQWLNAGNIFGLGHDKDFILGDAYGKGKMTIQGSPPFFLAPQENFVRTRGGEYLFVPGMTALAALADGTAG